MAKDPEERFDSATAVMEALEEANGGGTRLPPPPAEDAPVLGDSRSELQAEVVTQPAPAGSRR